MRGQRESAYDDLLHLALRLAGAKVAAISRIDDGWLRSEATTHEAFREMPLEPDAPPIQILRSGDPLVVLDATADARFSSCRFFEGDPSVRFFAGVPVLASTGQVLGVLFAADQEPREQFASADVVSLTKIAAVAAELMESHLEREGEPADSGSVQRFEALTNLIPQIVWSTTPDGYHDYFNDRWYAYTGMPRTADQGWSWKEYLHPDDVQRTLEVWHRALDTGEPYEVTYRFRRASDGEYRWFIGRAVPLRDASGTISRWFGTCTDVHEERVAEEKVARLADFRHAVMGLVEDSLTAARPEDFFQEVLERAVAVIPGAEAGSVLFRAPDGMFEFVASVGYDLALLRQVRFTAEQVSFGGSRSKQPAEITDFSGGTPESERERNVMNSVGRISEIEVTLNIPVVLDDDAVAYLSLDNFQTPDAFGEEATEMARIFAGYVATLSQRFRLERQLHRLAYEDVLTELPNRASIEMGIAEAFERVDASGGSAAILFMDLDGFKAVNDTLGHRAGDEVLRVVGRRLSGCTRASEAVGRLGGDEFAVVLAGEDVAKQAHVVAERALKALAEPIVTQDGTVNVTASIGIALYPADGGTLEEVLQSADTAMYRAKERGKNTYGFFRHGV